MLRSSSGPLCPAPARCLHALGLALALLCNAWGISAYAQHAQDEERHTLVLRGVAAGEALEALVEKTGLSLLYESGLVPPDPVYCAVREQPAETMLRCILDAVRLDYVRLSSGTYVLTRPVEAPTRYGSFAGNVVDAETGEPLPYATVLLADASTGTATDADGRFAMAQLTAGPYRVMASYVGYEAHLDSVMVPEGGQARRQIALRRTTSQAAPVVVNGLQQRLPSETLGRGARTLDQANWNAEAASLDPLDQAATVLGVTRSPALADLHIQGGEAGEHQFLLDGIPVFYPVALGRMLGAFSPLALGRLTVQKAGFGARHGSYTAGVIEAEHTLTPPGQVATRGGIAVLSDQLSTSGRLHAPFRIGQASGKAMVSARTSLWGLVRDPVLDRTLRDWNVVDPVFTRDLLGGQVAPGGFDAHRHGSDLSFADLHAAASLRLTPFTSLHTTGYYGRSSIGTELFASTPAPSLPTETSANGRDGATEGVNEEALLMLTRDHYRWSNAGARVRATTLLGARTMLETGFRASAHRLDHAYEMGTQRFPAPTDVPTAEATLRDQLDANAAADDANRVSEIALDSRATYSVSPSHLLEGGLELVRVDHRFTLDGGNGLGLDSLELADAQWRMAGYLGHTWTLGLRTVIEPGLRATYVPDRATAYLEPRLSIRHDLARGPITAVRIAGGLYRQFVEQYDLSNLGPSALAPSVRFWLPIGRDLAPPRTYQAALDVLATPHAAWTIQAEGYYKWQPLIHALNYDVLVQHASAAGETAPTPITQAALLEPGEGFAYGLALRVTHTHRRGTASVSYGYDVAERRFASRFDGRYVQAPWNEPHRLTAWSDLNVGGGVQVHGRWRSVLGRAWGFRQAYYDFFEDEPLGPFQFDAPASDDVPAHHELDLGVSLTRAFSPRAFGTPTVALRIDVRNVFDRANVLDWSLEGTSEGAGYAPLTRYLPGRSLHISAQVLL
ncbi:MAG: carboxypeptidase-like regulatory domain-containing protein [Bacteroidota bacterium]